MDDPPDPVLITTCPLHRCPWRQPTCVFCRGQGCPGCEQRGHALSVGLARAHFRDGHTLIDFLTTIAELAARVDVVELERNTAVARSAIAYDILAGDGWEPAGVTGWRRKGERYDDDDRESLQVV